MIHISILLFFVMLLALGCSGKEKDQFLLEGTIWADKNAEWVSPVGAGDEESAMNLLPMYFGPDGQGRPSACGGI